MKRHWKKFIIFTFLLTYVCHGALAILNHQGVIQLLSFPGQVLYILGGSSPTIMAFVVVHKFYSGDEKKPFTAAWWILNSRSFITPLPC